MSVRVTLEKLAYDPLFPNADAMAQLEAEPDLPELCEDVWEAFYKLHVRRFRDENGPRPFSWVELQSFMGVTGVRLDNWQLETIFALDAAYFSVEAENRK